MKGDGSGEELALTRNGPPRKTVTSLYRPLTKRKTTDKEPSPSVSPQVNPTGGDGSPARSTMAPSLYASVDTPEKRRGFIPPALSDTRPDKEPMVGVVGPS